MLPAAPEFLQLGLLAQRFRRAAKTASRLIVCC